MARKKAPKRKPVDENVVLTERRLRDRDELLAFQPPVEANKDYISRLPTETIHGILSYIILDHDAGRGVKITTKNAAFKDQPHVLLSISTLSKHFHANVESFSLHYLTKHKALYSLKTAVKATADSEPRRSARLALKPKIDTQAHRAELNLSDALRRFELRDYMLIKSRAPGPRAKHTDLPAIPYATLRTDVGFRLGWRLSYRFFERDVRMIAGLVHGDVQEHMEMKLQQRLDRKDNRLRKLHIELKIRYHTNCLDEAESEGEGEYHQRRIVIFQDPEWQGNWRKSIDRRNGYGEYDDVHSRICAIEPCEDCEEQKEHRRWCNRGGW